MLQSEELSHVCLVVPCYNEAKRLDVQAFRAYLQLCADVHFIFVNDGSSDATQELLDQIRRDLPGRSSVLKLPRNVGKAESVRAGLNVALKSNLYQLIGYWDADLATPLQSIKSFVETMRNRPDIEMVFGSRVKLCGREINRLPARHYLGRIFATAVSILLALPIYDTQCGAKLFRVREETHAIFAEPFVSGWIFDVEILARFLQVRSAKVLERQIFEYPLEKWTDVAGSKVKPADFIKAFFEMMTIGRKYFTYPGRPKSN